MRVGWRCPRGGMIIVGCLLILMGCGVARAQEGLQFTTRADVDTYHGVRAARRAPFTISRTRARAWVQADYGHSSAVVSAMGTYNALLPSLSGFNLREAFMEYHGDYWGLRAGRQLVIWGNADGVRITDLVSPMDLSEFMAQDYDDIRQSVNALRLFLFGQTVRLELVAVPTFEGYTLPVERANPWSLLPRNTPWPVEWVPDGKPAFSLKNMEYGGRVSVSLPGIDFNLAGLYTWNKMPVLEYEMTPSGMRIHPRHYRMAFVGGDASKPVGQCVLRAELACNFGKHFSYQPMSTAAQRGFFTTHWLVGLDWFAAHEWNVSVQFSYETIAKHQPYVMQHRHSMLATLNVSKKLLNSTLQLANFSYYDVRNKGWFSRFSADYALSDQIHLMAGYDWIGGDKGSFAQYKDNSQVWLRAKYSF